MFCVRDIVTDDYPCYVEMVEGFYSGGAALHGMNAEHVKKTFDAAVEQSPYLRIVIIEQDGETAGFALFAFTWSNESGGMVAWLEELYVLPCMQGRQIGSKFLAWMMEEYKDFSRIRLEVCHTNPGAIRLYERNGFEVLDYLQMVKDKK